MQQIINFSIQSLKSKELRGSKVVGSIPSHACNFSTPDCKKINKAPSVWVKVICSDRRHFGGTHIKEISRGIRHNLEW